MPKKKSSNISERSQFILDVFRVYVAPEMTCLEIGEGDGRHVKVLKENGFNVEGIDKKNGTAIEDVPFKEYDVIYSMSAFFLIPPENAWVFEKIAKMAKRYIITIEGEVTDYRRNLWGRNYEEVFRPFGFLQIDHQDNVFNEYGKLRVFERIA